MRDHHVELTRHSIKVDGIDISDRVTAVAVHVDPVSLPLVTIDVLPDAFHFAGRAAIHYSQLDGIERLRARQRHVAPEAGN